MINGQNMREDELLHEIRWQNLVEKGGFVVAGSDPGAVQFVAVEGGAIVTT